MQAFPSRKVFLASLTVAFLGALTLFQAGIFFPSGKIVPAHGMVKELDVLVPMRDGVRLATDVVRPAGPGPFAAILVRTPYGKNYPYSQGWVKAGYALVCQDCRGRFKSEGEFYPLRNEGEDGYDTIEWIASRPWCNGRVGMAGTSYGGAAQLLAAMEDPPHLTCIAPVVPPGDLDRGMVFNGGTLRMELILGWLLGMTRQGRRVLTGEAGTAEIRAWEEEPFGQRVWHLPLKNKGALGLGGEGYSAFWRDIIRGWENPDFWEALSPIRQSKKIRVPVLLIGGFNDVFAREELELLDALRNRGGSPETLRYSSLLMGPWGHHVGGSAGEWEFPAAMERLDGLTGSWYAYWLQDRPTGMDALPPIQYFVINSDCWRTANQWPPLETERRSFFLGEETLAVQAPEFSKPTVYTYDPGKPTPTLGGCNLRIANGIHDHKKRGERKDVVTFFTEPLNEDLTVAGPVTVRLFVSSSAPDTDFAAMLVDQGPDDYVANVADGITRLRYRQGRDQSRWVKPGEVVEVVVDCWSTAWTFKRGHRLGLHLSSANFPRFDRNLNTRNPMGRGLKFQSAENRILHDREHPSSLEVFVLEMD